MKLPIVLFSLALVTSSYLASSQPLSNPSHYSTLAEKGDAKAQYKLALHLLQGDDVSKAQEIEAFKWMEKSAEQGYVDALLELGFFYEWGIGTSISINQALLTYKKAIGTGRREVQDRINILKAPIASDNEHFASAEISPSLEAYYIALLLQTYELYAESLGGSLFFHTDRMLYLQYQARYFTSVKGLPESYKLYINNWRNEADRMLELINTVPDEEFEEAWDRGLRYISDYEAKHPELSMILSLEQAKRHVNHKYKMDIHMKNYKKVAKALSARYNYSENSISLFKNLVITLKKHYMSLHHT